MKLRANFAPRPPAPAPRPKAPPESARTDDSVSPAARNLALAYRLDAMIANGLLADYTAAARLLGVSQVRVTHLMSMLLLAPTIQDAILAGTLAPGDKDLRRLARIADWTEQLAQVAECRRRRQRRQPARAVAGATTESSAGRAGTVCSPTPSQEASS